MNIPREARLAHHRRPDVIIGKKGVTMGVLKEIDRRLEDQGIVKVKMLKTAIQAEGGDDRRTIASRVAKSLDAVLVGVRGRTFVLYRRPGIRKFK